MKFAGPKTEETEFAEKKWEKPFCQDLKQLEGVSFGKMKIIVKKLDRFCDEVLDENHLLNVENEIHLDLIDEIEDKFHEVGNVNIFLNNHLNENKLGLRAQEAVRQALQVLFLGQEKEISAIKGGLGEIDRRVDRLCRTARQRVLGRQGALHLEMEKYGAHTWNTREKESRERSHTEHCKEKLSTRNFLNQVIDIVEVEEDKKRSSREEEDEGASGNEDSDLFSDGSRAGEREPHGRDTDDLGGSPSLGHLKESPLINCKDPGAFGASARSRSGGKSRSEDSELLEDSRGSGEGGQRGFCYMQSGSGLKLIISEDSKQTEKFKTTISDQKQAALGERMTEAKKQEERPRGAIKPFGASFEDEESDLGDSGSESGGSAAPRRPEIPQLDLLRDPREEEKKWTTRSASMDLNSKEESLDNCDQEVMDFTNKGKKISMISLANKRGGFGHGFGAKRVSAIGYGFGSSMRMIQGQPDLARNYMTERPRRREGLEEIPLRKEIQKILGGSYAKKGSGSNSTLRYNQNARMSQPPRNQPKGDEARLRQLLRVEKAELERVLDQVERIREEVKLVCVQGESLFARIEDGFERMGRNVEKLFLRLCEAADKSVYEEYLLHELTVVPKREVEGLLQNASKNQNDKVVVSAELKAKKKRLETAEKKLREYEAKNHRLVFNNLQLKKQIESLSRKVTVLENKRQKEDEMQQRFGEVELKSLRLKLNQFEIREKQAKEEQAKIENKNFNLLRRKDHLVVNLKQDLRLATGEIGKLREKLRELALQPAKRAGEARGETCSIDGDAAPAGESPEPKPASQAEVLEAKEEEIHDLKKRLREQANELENLSMRITELKMEAEAEQNKFLDEIKTLDAKIEEIEQANAEFSRCNAFLTRRVDELRQENEKLRAAGGGNESYLFSDPPLGFSQEQSGEGQGEKILDELNLPSSRVKCSMKGDAKRPGKDAGESQPFGQPSEYSQPAGQNGAGQRDAPTGFGNAEMQRNPFEIPREREKLFEYMSESEIVKLQQSEIYEKNSLLFNTGDKVPFEELQLEFEKKDSGDRRAGLREKSKTTMLGGPTLVSRGSIFGEGCGEEDSEAVRFKKSKSVIGRRSLGKGRG